MDIEQKLAELKTARESAAFYHAEMKTMIENLKVSLNYKISNTHATTADDKIAELESTIRGAALDEYEATKNKQPFPKVTIKIFKTFRIVDAKKVWDWAFGNLPAALKLDEKKIEKYAVEFGDVDGTERGEEARAQIATEL